MTPPRKPLGKALRRTAADLERLSQIAPADIQAARQLWHELAPPKYRGLIEAKPEPQEKS